MKIKTEKEIVNVRMKSNEKQLKRLITVFSTFLNSYTFKNRIK